MSLGSKHLPYLEVDLASFQGQDMRSAQAGTTSYTTQEAAVMLWLRVTCDSSLGSHISPGSVASKGFPDTFFYAADPTGALDEPEPNVVLPSVPSARTTRSP